jgi:hypothetical protein
MSNGARRSWTEHAALAGWTLLAILYRGYGFGVGDQNLYLPFVLKWANPELFPNDYLLSLGYARESVTWIAMSWFARLMDIRWVAGAAYVLASYLTLWAVLRLAQAWWDDRLAGWIAVLIWTPVYQLPGSGMNTVDPYFTARGLSYALCLWALFALVRNRTAGVVLCLCCAALVHSVSVIPVAGAVALFYLFKGRWRAFGVLAASMTGAALLLLTMAFTGGAHDLWGRYDSEWYAIALQGASCLFPTAWNALVWSRLLLYAGLCMGLLAMGGVRKGTVPHLEVSGALVIGALALWPLSWLGAEARAVLPVQLSLMRSCWVLILLLCLALAGWCARVLQAGRWPQAVAAAVSLGAWITDQPLLQTFAFAVMAAAVAPPILGPSLRRLIERWRLSAQTGVLALMAVLVGLYALHFYWGRALPWSMPGLWTLVQAGVVAGALSLGWMLLGIQRPGLFGGVMATGFLLGLLVQPMPFAITSLGRMPGVGHLYRMSAAHTFSRRMGAPGPRVREQLAEAIRATVPIGATVIVPAGWDSFRVATLRSSFVTLEDMIPGEFSRSFAMEWRARMRALYGPDFFTEVDSLVGAAPLEPDAVMALAGRYPELDLEYIVSTRRYPFPKLAESGGWTLYRIARGTKATA